jgi:GT2 family glycosyltransferase
LELVGNAAMTAIPQPSCTVCIANYNGESLLVDCIDSVLNQQCDFAFDIVVHDDASTDKSLELLATRYPQVKVIAGQSNVGFCVSNNRMVKEATTQFILLLNNDAALAPDALETLFNHAMQQVTQGILSLPQYDWESGALVDRGCLLDPFYNPVPNLDPNKQNVAMVIGACLWIPRTLWVKLGGFPEWFESVAEDMQLCCHARLSGFPVEVAQKSGYRHRQGKSFGGNRSIEGRLETSYRRRRFSERNKTFVMALCTPKPLIWFLLPVHMLTLLAEGIILSIGKFKFSILTDIYINTLSSLISNRKTLIMERQPIQKAKIISVKYYRSAFTAYPQKIKLLLKFGIPNIR